VRPTTWLPLAALALLVGFTLWLNQLVQPQGARGDGSKRHDPDVVVDNFSARKLDEAGLVRYTLGARKMVHYPDDDSALLDKVTLEAYEPKQPKMTITADHGRLEQGGDRVWIEGNVVMVREADDKADRARLTTDRMLVLPDEGIARTTSEVRIDSPSGRVHAAGLELNNKTRTLQLNRVQFITQPKRRCAHDTCRTCSPPSWRCRSSPRRPTARRRS
jgi:lipopolysaccharide export system protein LptC